MIQILQDIIFTDNYRYKLSKSNFSFYKVINVTILKTLNPIGILMYRIFSVRERIRVPPQKFNANTRESIKDSISEDWEGKVDPQLGVVLDCVSVEEIGEGKIIA